MWRKFFGRRARVVTDNETSIGAGGQNRLSRAVITVVLVSVVLLAVSGGCGSTKTAEKEKKETAAEFNMQQYAEKTEERLKKTLSGIKGAGEVDVMVSFESAAEKVLARNAKTDKKENLSGGANESSSQSETSVMLYGSNSNQQPYVLKEKLPEVSGVLVLASGADSETVRLEIYEAVRALYGISGHRIKVVQKGLSK